MLNFFQREETAKLPLESVLQVTGTVIPRPKGQENKV